MLQATNARGETRRFQEGLGVVLLDGDDVRGWGGWCFWDGKDAGDLGSYATNAEAVEAARAWARRELRTRKLALRYTAIAWSMLLLSFIGAVATVDLNAYPATAIPWALAWFAVPGAASAVARRRVRGEDGQP